MKTNYKFALDPKSNEVRHIMFERTLVDGEYSVTASRRHTPEVQNRRAQDWTKEQIQEELAVCETSVCFIDLLRKRMAVKKKRGNKMSVVTTTSEEL